MLNTMFVCLFVQVQEIAPDQQPPARQLPAPGPRAVLPTAALPQHGPRHRHHPTLPLHVLPTDDLGPALGAPRHVVPRVSVQYRRDVGQSGQLVHRRQRERRVVTGRTDVR